MNEGLSDVEQISVARTAGSSPFNLILGVCPADVSAKLTGKTTIPNESAHSECRYIFDVAGS